MGRVGSMVDKVCDLCCVLQNRLVYNSERRTSPLSASFQLGSATDHFGREAHQRHATSTIVPNWLNLGELHLAQNDAPDRIQDGEKTSSSDQRLNGTGGRLIHLPLVKSGNATG